MDEASEMRVGVGHINKLVFVEDHLLIEYFDYFDGSEVDDAVFIELLQQYFEDCL